MGICLTIQKNLNGEVHQWYRTILGYPDHIVSELIERFSIRPGQLVVDPFCGAGTTLVECMKMGIRSIGIDANPSSCFSARVKTNWNLNPDRLLELSSEIQAAARKHLDAKSAHLSDPTYRYLEASGMLERKWISRKPLRKALALKNCISHLRTTSRYRNALMLALVSEIVHGASNVRFGPELCKGKIKRDAKILKGLRSRIETMAQDLRLMSRISPTVPAKVIRGDSRTETTFSKTIPRGSIACVICSPPYPAEHDYTRNSRLELAFLEHVRDIESLRSIKKTMIRSHTKGIYAGDNDQDHVRGSEPINQLVSEIEPRVRAKSHGFAKLYPRVVREYFGGMKRHLQSIKPFLEPGAFCAYVVGDQSSYLQVHIPTAAILSGIAREIGFRTTDIAHWRSRWSTKTSREVRENILILQNV